MTETVRLSGQEQIVFRFIVLEGLSTKEIAGRMTLSENTVKTIRGKILAKLRQETVLKMTIEWWKNQTLALGVDLTGHIHKTAIDTTISSGFDNSGDPNSGTS